ncbi:MAG: methyltransferase domain-containing protein [Candidatus Mcinerneyibacterium aminivorans]|uniref:Methyltransferase domain-containing protein n=1 Tax=Candidatus Mcinerneyibacterium aminivorans TaxID=2703815 RepID=A0A5D0MCA4_9BACT|nr:MAG: methyltransferase domain-containing protein [Candidatus Mcinerneyibacterium aminivorans]
MGKLYEDSHIEINGLVAKHYSRILNLITLGRYKRIIKRFVDDMNIVPEDRIIDFGAGSGYNECFMIKYLSLKGRIVGLDIGEDMIKKFKKVCKKYPNVKIYKKRIDIPLNFENKYDKALISFVLHGLPHKNRIQVLKNANRALKKNKRLYIFDYAKFNLEKLPFYIKIPFKMIECKYAFEYIEKDWKKIIKDTGFKFVRKKYYYKNIVSMMIFEKYS